MNYPPGKVSNDSMGVYCSGIYLPRGRILREEVKGRGSRKGEGERRKGFGGRVELVFI